MIVEWFFQLASGFSSWVSSFFSGLTVPDGLTQSTAGLTAFLNGAAGLGAWFPWAVLSAVLGALVVLYIAGFTVKTLLKIASFFPFVGGTG